MFAGIDTHKDTLAVAVIDAASRLLVSRELPNSENGFRQLVRLFDTNQVLRVGSEGSGASAGRWRSTALCAAKSSGT